MRRKDREITDIDKIETIIASARYMHLGMFDGEFPYIVPLHYGYQADIPCKYGAEYESVMCRGKTMNIEDIKEKCKALGVLMKVQTGEEYEIDDKMASAVNVVKIDVESYTAKACIR